jgi:carboxynorspermidine decarboxylase
MTNTNNDQTSIRGHVDDVGDSFESMTRRQLKPSELRVRELRTPCYLIDERMLERNARILRQIKQVSGCKILLAQKAFSCYPLYDMLARYLDGAASSGLYEARLAREEMGEDCEVHVYAPAYDESEFDDYLGMVDTMVFNSFEQWERFRERVFEHNLSGERQISCGLRINPGYSEVETGLYDAASRDSRLGVPAEDFKIGYEKGLFDGLNGIHFHSLCQQNADVLERTLDAIRKSFGPFPERLSWINFGGGHHITKDDYDIDLLVKLIRRTADETGATVYLEPGEAVALDAGWLVASVLDLVKKPDYVIAILNASATCHMPDVLEMPYTPKCFIVPTSGRSSSASVWYEGVEPGVKPYNIQLAGPTCLAGDVIGNYSFDVPPLPGDLIVLTDMAIYTMVKNNTFNGIPLPSIMLQDKEGNIVKLKRFGYEDFKGRLG